MSVFNANDVPERLLAPGFHAHPMHGDALTIVRVSIDANSTLPTHSHPHEQAVNVLSGRLFLRVGGVDHELRAGTTLFIPGGLEHGGYTVEPAEVIDVFTPTRDDLR